VVTTTIGAFAVGATAGYAISGINFVGISMYHHKTPEVALKTFNNWNAPPLRMALTVGTALAAANTIACIRDDRDLDSWNIGAGTAMALTGEALLVKEYRRMSIALPRVAIATLGVVAFSEGMDLLMKK